MNCGCQVTGHEPGCWLSLNGYYINGVKVARLAQPQVTIILPQPIVVVVQTGGTP